MTATLPTIHAALIGAPKAGTTSLYRYLAQHPQLMGHEQREMAYFLSDEDYQQGWGKAYAQYFAGHQDQKLLAKHVFHMYQDAAMQRLAEHHPQMRLIAVLRNPVDRAYSAYWYARRRGWETAATFEEALALEADRLQEDWHKHRTELYCHTGEYVQHLERVLRYFPRQQLHVVLTDDLKQDARRVCQQCFEHLQVEADFVPDLTRKHNPASQARHETLARGMAGFFRSKGKGKHLARKVVPARFRHRLRYAAMRLNEKPFTPPAMNPETRAKLEAELKPHNEKLAQWLGRDEVMW